MARTVNQVKEFIYAQMALKPSLAALLSNPSQVAVWKDFIHCVAVEMVILEQLQDEFKAEVAATLASGTAPSIYWVRTKAFEFQYDSVTPQIIELVDLIPQYAVVDPTKRIITRCTATTGAGAVTLLAAKNEPPEKLSAPELASLQSYYINTGDGTSQAIGLGWGGQAISCYSYDPDLLYMEATIKYNGQYASTIVSDTILAITNYISNLGQNPVMRTVSLTDALQSVLGFQDVFIHNLSCRSAAIAWMDPGVTDLVLSDATLLTEYTAAAGYMIGETTATFTLLDKLTFVAV